PRCRRVDAHRPTGQGAWRVPPSQARRRPDHAARRQPRVDRQLSETRAMQFTAEHEMFRASVRELVEREINPYADEWEAAGMFPAHELFPKLGKLGVFGLEYDPAYGGMGADHSYTVVYGEEMGRSATGGVSMACSVQSDMATPSLARFGS